MSNLLSVWRINLSVLGAIIGSILFQLPTWAQVPTFEGTESVPIFKEPQSTPPVSGIESVPIFNKPQSIPHVDQSGLLNSSYLLGPGDEIQLNVLPYQELTNLTYVIMPDGTITVPLIGRVMAANRTITDFNQELTILLKKWLKNPNVNLNITKFRPLIINVAGEVQRPGPLQLSSVSNATINSSASFNPSNITNPNGIPTVTNQLPTVSVALLAAGGVTREADIRQVVLKRFSPTGNSQTIPINLWDSLWSENGPRNLLLQDGDSIFVPKLAVGESLDPRLVSRSSIAPRIVRVRVVGEVKKPGEIELTPDSSLSSAIASAGGPTDKAKLSEVTFIRLNDDGTIAEESVDLSKLSDTYQVEEGDVVIVPKRNTYSVLDFATDVLNPLNLFRNLFRKN